MQVGLWQGLRSYGLVLDLHVGMYALCTPREQDPVQEEVGTGRGLPARGPPRDRGPEGQACQLPSLTLDTDARQARETKGKQEGERLSS